MAEVLLFHHSRGQTPGFLAFADGLRQAGHTVHTPDLFDGKTFESIDEGMAHIQGVGFGDLTERGVRAADELPAELVYAGISFGVMAAQKLAQTRAGARGALFFESCAPPDYFGESWPVDLPVQIHGKDADPFFVGEGDVEFARAIVASAKRGELFLYPGEEHLFVDSSLPSYDADATDLLRRRVLEFLAML
jgi:dienelactone hydrolase